MHRGVANLPEFAQLLLVHHLEIGDRRLAAGTPIDDVGSAIDQALFIEPDKGLAHCR